uniref:Uncharacterized protein n=1 Tax=Anopheles quadriannulatus TaxID=34691 RepID=A0A182XPZ2_ANOQN
ASLTAVETLPESVPQQSQECDESIPVDAHEDDDESDDGADSFNEDDPLSDINDDSDWSDDEGLNIRKVQFQEKLRRWALSSNISHYARKLISSCRKILEHRETLLKTSTATSIDIKNIAGGQFWYNGVANCLKSYFTTMQPGPSTLWLDFSMDGLPIHNSGPTQLWPILMCVTDLPQAPVFVVALFCGKTKPASAEDYLRQLLTELNRLQSAGVMLGGKKGAIAHTGYDSCLKCTEHTVYDRSTHRMHFSGVDAPKRTAKHFKAGRYKNHCKNSTPLIALTYFDIIDDVPTTDRLHLIDLGVMRFLMRSWKKGIFGKKYKWTLDDISFISSMMETVKLPSEVPRKLRSVKYLRFWKGAEFKNFLHYPS